VSIGFNLKVDQHLVGSKFAVVSGSDLILSPAMYDLMSHADEDEQEHLLESIKCVYIPPAHLILTRLDDIGYWISRSKK
jgi:hypothetical protein